MPRVALLEVLQGRSRHVAGHYIALRGLGALRMWVRVSAGYTLLVSKLQLGRILLGIHAAVLGLSV